MVVVTCELSLIVERGLTEAECYGSGDIEVPYRTWGRVYLVFVVQRESGLITAMMVKDGWNQDRPRSI